MQLFLVAYAYQLIMRVLNLVFASLRETNRGFPQSCQAAKKTGSENSPFVSSPLFHQIQITSRTFDDKRVRIAFVVLTPEIMIIEITEIHAAAGVLVDLRCKRDPVTRHHLTAFGSPAGISDMSEMRRDAKIFLKLTGFGYQLLHSFDNAIPILLDQAAVRFR